MGWVSFLGAALNFCEISGFGTATEFLFEVLKAKLNLELAGPVGAVGGALEGGVLSPVVLSSFIVSSAGSSCAGFVVESNTSRSPLDFSMLERSGRTLLGGLSDLLSGLVGTGRWPYLGGMSSLWPPRPEVIPPRKLPRENPWPRELVCAVGPAGGRDGE